MDAVARKPFQGINNILIFNRHFFIAGIGLSVLLLFAIGFATGQFKFVLTITSLLIISSILISLTVSYYVYDCSPLYQLQWLDQMHIRTDGVIINLHAGLDETSLLLAERFPDARLMVFDFYDPSKHTEISIKRARKSYPPFKGTISIQLPAFPLPDKYADLVILFMSAHEIRNEAERNEFFSILKCKLKPGGKIAVIEHLRDLPNFLAYNIGFFHFYAKPSWQKVFNHADLRISNEFRITPFITAFILENNASSS